MFRSIRWRIAAAFAVLLVVCIGGLSAYLSHFFQRQLHGQPEDAAHRSGQAGRRCQRAVLRRRRDGDLDALAKRLGEQIDARVTIIGSDGTVLGDSEEDPADMENHSDRPEVMEALAEGTGSDIRRSETLHRDMMYVAAAIAPDGDIVGVARVALPLTEINAAMGHINVAIAVGALIAAVLGILLAFQITRITVDPIKRLTSDLQRNGRRQPGSGDSGAIQGRGGRSGQGLQPDGRQAEGGDGPGHRRAGQDGDRPGKHGRRHLCRRSVRAG